VRALLERDTLNEDEILSVTGLAAPSGAAGDRPAALVHPSN
jgi:hypothetical protein